MLDNPTTSASLAACGASVSDGARAAAGYFFYGYWFSHSGV
ncbi:MAG TPA: hypothetical protein VKY70_06880 [Pseudomonas sp.]|jgi:hypothetical protein|nr:hypothetical protein [Pseudomonas sp.]